VEVPKQRGRYVDLVVQEEVDIVVVEDRFGNAQAAAPLEGSIAAVVGAAVVAGG
jgi:hypothetical protein